MQSFRYTSRGMPVLENIAAIAKGMSITFMEMFQPTLVENYPDGPGPLKGAKFQERYPRRARAAARRERPGKMRGLLPVRRRLPVELHLHRGRREHRASTGSAAPSATPRSTTSTTTAAFSAATASRPVRPTPSPTATASKSPASTPATWSIAKSRCWPPCQPTWEQTRCSIETKWQPAHLRYLYRGAKVQ